MSEHKIPITLGDLAAAIDAELIGDGSIKLRRAVHPTDADGEGDLALAMDRRLVPLLADSNAAAAVISNPDAAAGPQRGHLVVGRSRYALARIMEIFAPLPSRPAGIHPTACVEDSAEIADGVSIGPFVYVGHGARIGARTVLLDHVSVAADATIGEDCLLFPGSRCGERVVLGDRVIVQPNAEIGSDGFSFVTPDPGSVEAAKERGRVDDQTNTRIVRINSAGTVIIGDDVEIGANSTIDRGTVAATRIGNHTKLDNLVHVAHNVVIGENCMICGQVGIAGSSVIGDRVVMAGQAGVSDHVTVGDDSVIAGKSGVGRNIGPKSVVAGYPARDKAVAFQEIATLRRLGSFMEQVKQLKARLKALEERAGGK